ncbi:MAG: hypothetical protein HYZ48_00590 [Chlamydiales bacterium]|nr:hypothetical protein [Chlamydiales bacterium]
MPSLYIIDAVNFLFRSYYAIKGMTNSKGVATNALYGFIRSVYKIIDDFSPDYVVAVFDGPDNKQSRTAIYKEYKGHRSKMPEDLYHQLLQAIEFCKMAGIPFLTLPYVEADDTMGSIAKWAEKQKIHSFLCSSDKDLCQLVNSHTQVIHAHKNNLLIDREKVKELFGVWPEQIIDYLSIVGDSSDNIPGLEGFGAKTAVDLLEKFSTLENIFSHVEHFSGKKKDTLEKGVEIALISKQLATIQLDLEIPQDKDFYKLKAPDLLQLQSFYQEMRFSSLAKELNVDALEKLQEQKPVSYTSIDDIESLK